MSVIPGGVPIAGFISPTDSTDLFPVTDPKWGLGGLRTVSATTERDAIVSGRRQVGMLVYVSGNTTYYELGSGLTNSDWTVFNPGGFSGGNFLSITGGTLTGPTFAPAFSATTLSGGTIYSGSTNLGFYISTIQNNINNKFDKTGGTITGSVIINNDVQIGGTLTITGSATTINTQNIQAQDNNIILNFSGNHLTAIGGGLTLISGQTSGAPSTMTADTNGNWIMSPGLYSLSLTGGTIYSGGTELSTLFGSSQNTTILQNQIATKANRSGDTFTGQINAPSISGNSLSATTLYSGSTDLSSLFGSIGSITYSNSAATPSTLGGIAAGSTFSAQTIANMFDALLYPYQTPAFSSFSIAGQSQTLEVGDTVAGGSRTFNWATTNSANINSNSISIKDNTSGVTLAAALANDGTEAISISAITNSTATSNVWGIFATNTHSVIFNTTFTVNWRFRIHYGTNASTSLTSAQITGLTSSSLTSTFVGTFSFAAGDYKYFTYPASFGTATSFKDAGTGFAVSMQPVTTVSVTNPFGVVATYNVHRTTNPLVSSINIQIS